MTLNTKIQSLKYIIYAFKTDKTIIASIKKIRSDKNKTEH